jgi:periplasmic protein TonB
MSIVRKQDIEEEKKNKRIALISSVAFHGALLLAFLFVIAWRAPDPPLPEYGIELNFGLDKQGSGQIQPDRPVGSTEQPAETKQEVKNDVPEDSPEPTATEAKPQEAKPVEQPVTTKQESPVVVKEPKKEEVKKVETPKEKVQEKPVETKEPVKSDPNAVYNPNKSQSTADKSQSKTGTSGSQGDDVNKTGDKGDPKGSLDAKALYGKQGGGDGGSSFNLDGWNWDYIPKPNVPDNETGGRIVFKIIVDSNGEVRSIEKIESSVSVATEKACREAVEKLTFTKTGLNVPSMSTGTITFVVRSH